VVGGDASTSVTRHSKLNYSIGTPSGKEKNVSKNSVLSYGFSGSNQARAVIEGVGREIYEKFKRYETFIKRACSVGLS
jgi:hypothetical protein